MNGQGYQNYVYRPSNQGQVPPTSNVPAYYEFDSQRQPYQYEQYPPQYDPRIDGQPGNYPEYPDGRQQIGYYSPETDQKVNYAPQYRSDEDYYVQESRGGQYTVPQNSDYPYRDAYAGDPQYRGAQEIYSRYHDKGYYGPGDTNSQTNLPTHQSYQGRDQQRDPRQYEGAYNFESNGLSSDFPYDEYSGREVSTRPKQPQQYSSEEDFSDPRGRYEPPPDYLIPRPTHYGRKKQVPPKTNNGRVDPRREEESKRGSNSQNYQREPDNGRKNYPNPRSHSTPRMEDEPRNQRHSKDYTEQVRQDHRERYPNERGYDRTRSADRYKFSNMENALPKVDYDRSPKRHETFRAPPQEAMRNEDDYYRKDYYRNEHYPTQPAERQYHRNEARSRYHDGYQHQSRYYN